jgi:hypothetical protein
VCGLHSRCALGVSVRLNSFDRLPELLGLDGPRDRKGISVQGIDKYVKKKQLDPLVSYVPVLLIAEEQLDFVPLAAQENGVEATRSLLRKGAFVGLRDNIRCVGEYSAAVIGKDEASARVKKVFVSLEALDSALLLVGILAWFTSIHSHPASTYCMSVICGSHCTRHIFLELKPVLAWARLYDVVVVQHVVLCRRLGKRNLQCQKICKHW